MGKKIYLNDNRRVVDKSIATCWFADLLDDSGLPVGEIFGLITKSHDT